jgi:O-antigen ligase
MPAQTFHSVTPRFSALPSRSLVHTGALALVWLMMATSGLVFSEPCPTDILGFGLIILLPLIGMVHISPALAVAFFAWMLLGVLALIAALSAQDLTSALIHTAVSFYLYGLTIVMAGFIALRPQAHLSLIFKGWMVAAILAAAAGITGYFSLVPGSEIFTRFDRAAGTFKDPNVFGPFLVPAILYALHTALGRSWRHALWPLAGCAVLCLAVLLSFSRGAWLNLAIAAVVFLAMAFVTAQGDGLRRKIVALSLTAIASVAVLVAAALQIEQVSTLAEQRVSMDQSYDTGPEGRFGGQNKALTLLLDNPLGVGAQQFAAFHHHEEPHNVFLNMFLNAGWMGGLLYIAMVAITIAIGLGAARRHSEVQPFLLIALAAFIANVVEGVIIDTDHWRHFYILAAIIWGIATAPSTAVVRHWLHRRAGDRPSHNALA